MQKGRLCSCWVFFFKCWCKNGTNAVQANSLRPPFIFFYFFHTSGQALSEMTRRFLSA